MKDVFPGYYQLDDQEFDRLWKEAVFVFDTNVLLNLYRYQSSTRESLLEVIKKLLNRVWIPYHVGLEFQRNRLSVIAEQHNRFQEVRKIVEDSLAEMQKKLEGLQLRKRHSHINPDKLIEELNKVKNTYFDDLNDKEKESINISSKDPIRDQIDLLFKRKIGNSPQNQGELDLIYSEGEQRYANGIPPGFEDENKEEKKADCFTYSGILYRKKYGDLIVWKQIIKHAKENKLKDIIYVTDDNKSDWWLSLKGKTVGARPELIEEIHREAKSERFHIYNTDAFLEHANRKLNVNVTEDAIKEVREVAAARNSYSHNSKSTARYYELIERSVYEWLWGKFERVEQRQGFPDFVAYDGGIKLGFEVRNARNMLLSGVGAAVIEGLIQSAYKLLISDDFAGISIILVTDIDAPSINSVMNERAQQLIQRQKDFETRRINIIIGHIKFNSTNETYKFVPYENETFPSWASSKFSS